LAIGEGKNDDKRDNIFPILSADNKEWWNMKIGRRIFVDAILECDDLVAGKCENYFPIKLFISLRRVLLQFHTIFSQYFLFIICF
jgi:hypothetical protein